MDFSGQTNPWSTTNIVYKLRNSNPTGRSGEHGHLLILITGKIYQSHILPRVQYDDRHATLTTTIGYHQLIESKREINKFNNIDS